MTEGVERVPAETRWAIAAQALTGLLTATNKAMLDTVGPEGFKEMMGQICTEGGKGAKQITDALGLSGEDAKAWAAAAPLVATVIAGPEMKTETTEVTAEKAVIRCTECTWWNRAQELGISDDVCSAADSAFHNGLAKALNPKLDMTLTKAMPRGDEFCEWVFELQN